MTQQSAPHRILLVQLADRGDMILTTPALSALRAAYPAAHLTLLTPSYNAPLIEQTGLVDAILSFDRDGFNHTRAFLKRGILGHLWALRAGDYDTVVFFHHFTLWAGTLKFALIALMSGARRRLGLQNGHGWFLNETLPDDGFGAKHQARYWLDLVGLLGADTSARPATAQRAASLLPAATTPRVVIHAGGGGYNRARRWNPAYFAVVADQLHAEFNAEIVLVGGKDDNADQVRAAMHAPAHDLTGQTDLPALAGVIASADVFIGADSGVAHLAATTQTPMITLFGPSNHAAWQPWTPNSRHVVLRSAPICSPCSYIGHEIGLREGCDAVTCMKMITPEQVLYAARQYLSAPATGDDPMPTDANLDASPSHPFPAVMILGLPVHKITNAEWLDLIGAWIADPAPRLHQVCTTNPEFIVTALTDTQFHSILARCDLCVPDGVGLLWAARRLGQPLPERVTGSDGVPMIAERAAQAGWRLFLLGAAPGIADQAAEILCARYPGLQIAGTYSGSPAPEEEDAIVARVNASQADILLVAYGAPKQDKWIARNAPCLNVKMAMGIGGSLDFITGIIPRAPQWMRRYGLEWLYRLYLQPSRIGRMLRLPRFVGLVLRYGSASPR